jgi:hypothetical protein
MIIYSLKQVTKLILHLQYVLILLQIIIKLRAHSSFTKCFYLIVIYALKNDCCDMVSFIE